MYPRDEDKSNRAKSRIALVAGIVVVVVIYFLITSSMPYMEIYVVQDDSGLEFAYRNDKNMPMDPVHVDFADVQEVELVTDMDVGEYVSGADNRYYAFGQWENADFGEYTRCGEKSVDDYVVITTSKGVVAFNSESDETTATLCDNVVELLDQFRNGGQEEPSTGQE